MGCHVISKRSALTRTPILWLHATGICRIVLVMQTCDPYVHVSAVRWFHSPLIYCAVSLFVRMCELYIWLSYIQLCSSDCVNFNHLQFCFNRASQSRPFGQRLSLIWRSFGGLSWDAGNLQSLCDLGLGWFVVWINRRCREDGSFENAVFRQEVSFRKVCRQSSQMNTRSELNFAFRTPPYFALSQDSSPTYKSITLMKPKWSSNEAQTTLKWPTLTSPNIPHAYSYPHQPKWDEARSGIYLILS